ncbi:hypothetical protein TUM4261_22780 [Shewanella sp. c952]|uniref:hypothetical protein n=1 Tax=Shewanella sp. c952 TaxID=2815913 RepID=UPI001BBBC6E9|nr:hypothetical protein [Shewanella sp. c952]GIU11314.1 hypothetical protein TUM4261_22780 [Shewanella sp. c952]
MKVLGVALALSVFLVGCQSPTEYLQSYQPEATKSAENRFKFENDCSDVTTTLISSKKINMDSFARTYERPQYQIGVKGCQVKQVYTINCDKGYGCTVIAAAN